MKVLIYQGKYNVCVEQVFDLWLYYLDDIIVWVMVMVICGFDLYFYCGKVFGLKDGDIFGYEFMGIVEEVGGEVICVCFGDWVVVLFMIFCGKCFFCECFFYFVCEVFNLDCGVFMNKKDLWLGVGMFGYIYFYGGYVGGQVEYVCVFWVNVGLLVILDGLVDDQVLFFFDILLIGYQVLLNVDIWFGYMVVIFGVGLVGYMVVVCVCLFGVQ